jgi:LysM repeat protein
MNSVLQIGQALIIPGVLANQGVKTSYTVRHGDSACAVAARLGISCEAFLAANQMNMRTLIFPGQALRIPKRIPGSVARSTSTQKFDANEKESTAAAPVPVVRKAEILTAGTTVEYVVRKGDSACEIALRLETDCKRLLASNQLDKRAVIRPGQVLSVPGVPRDLAESLILESNKEITGTSPGVPSGQRQLLPEVEPLDQEIDLTIQTASRNGAVIYRINVEPEETLGHYSDWLKSGGTTSIRRLNAFAKGRQLRLGEVLLLPVENDGQRSAFDRERRDYHRVLVEEFKEHYDIIEVLNYVTKKGDSLWRLARTQGIPTWLIMRYNPLLRSAAPVVSQVLKMPRIQRQGS